MDKTFKIIVVDDDPMMGKLIQNCINNIDSEFDVLIFENSVDFFSAFENNKIELAIIDDDLNDAEIDGLYILKDIVSRGGDVKVIALSGDDSVQKVLEYMDNKAWKYISKNDHEWPQKIENSVKEAIMDFKKSKLMDNVSYERAIDLLLRKDELLNSFFNDFPSLFAILDKDGNFMMVNDSWKQLGWSRHDLKTLQIQHLACDDCASIFNAHLKSIFSTKVEFDCIVKTKDGDRIGVNWQIIQNKNNFFVIGKL